MKTRKCPLCAMPLGKQDAIDGGYWFCLSRVCDYTEDPAKRDAVPVPPPSRGASESRILDRRLIS